MGYQKVARLPVGKIDRREKAWTRNPGLRFLAAAWAADDGAFHDVSASFDANVVCHPIPSARLSNHLEHRTSRSVTNDTRIGYFRRRARFAGVASSPT
jgi:hypothetical protein